MSVTFENSPTLKICCPEWNLQRFLAVVLLTHSALQVRQQEESDFWSLVPHKGWLCVELHRPQNNYQLLDISQVTSKQSPHYGISHREHLYLACWSLHTPHSLLLRLVFGGPWSSVMVACGVSATSSGWLCCSTSVCGISKTWGDCDLSGISRTSPLPPRSAVVGSIAGIQSRRWSGLWWRSKVEWTGSRAQFVNCAESYAVIPEIYRRSPQTSIRADCGKYYRTTTTHDKVVL